MAGALTSNCDRPRAAAFRARTVGLAAALVALGTASTSEAKVIYVAPNGSAHGSGRITGPVRTITEGLDHARGGDTVKVMPGEYPTFEDRAVRRSRVTLRGTGRSRPQVDGAHMYGNSKLTVRGLRIGGEGLLITHRDMPGRAPVLARGIRLLGNEFTGSADNCLMVREARHILIAHNRVHDCRYGLGGPEGANRYSVVGIRLKDNVFEHFSGDAIRFGQWDRVSIDGNVIREMRDPAGVEHNDGIQVFGATRRVRITNNVIEGSSGQLVLVQEKVGGPNGRYLIANNLLSDAGSSGIQLEGTEVDLIGNTVWGTRYYGVLHRRGALGSVPHRSVFANNIVDNFVQIEGARSSYRGFNFFARSNVPRAHGEIRRAHPGFANAAEGDFHPRARAPVVGKGSPRRGLGRDLDGTRRPRRPAIGALEPHRR